MRCCKHTLTQTSRDGFTHVGERNIGVSFTWGSSRSGCYRNGRDIFLNVGFDDTASWTGSFNRFEGYASFKSKTAGNGACCNRSAKFKWSSFFFGFHGLRFRFFLFRYWLFFFRCGWLLFRFFGRPRRCFHSSCIFNCKLLERIHRRLVFHHHSYRLPSVSLIIKLESDIANRDIFFTCWEKNFGEISFILTLKIHLCFVCFYFHKDIARRNFITRLLLPYTDCTLSHCRAQCRHCNYLVAWKG